MMLLNELESNKHCFILRILMIISLVFVALNALIILSGVVNGQFKEAVLGTFAIAYFVMIYYIQRILYSMCMVSLES
tara:strand:+ start:885 stop:1115 length:231 start_codon:yes stop_codon:yes gene_type:complete